MMADYAHTADSRHALKLARAATMVDGWRDEDDKVPAEVVKMSVWRRVVRMMAA